MWDRKHSKSGQGLTARSRSRSEQRRYGRVVAANPSAQLECMHRRDSQNSRDSIASAAHRDRKPRQVRARNTTIETAHCFRLTYASESWPLGVRCRSLLRLAESAPSARCATRTNLRLDLATRDDPRLRPLA